MQENSKKCIDCKKAKPLSQFHKDRTQGSGYKPYCKPCNNIRQAKSYHRTKDKVLPRVRKYAKDDPERHRRIALKSMRTHLGEYNARTKVYQAIKAGKLKKMPCEVCGETKSEGHHHDYSKPLEVKWLCTVHHRELHRKHKIYEQSR